MRILSVLALCTLALVAIYLATPPRTLSSEQGIIARAKTGDKPISQHERSADPGSMDVPAVATAPSFDTLPQQPVPEMRISPDQKNALLRETYADLLSELSLSEEDARRFLLIVAAGWGDEQDQTSPCVTADCGRVDMQALLTLLGSEGFNHYEAFAQTLQQRNVIQGLAAELEARQVEPLSESTRQSLLSLLLEEYSALPPFDAERASIERRREQVERIKYFDHRVLQRSEFILSDTQLEVLRRRFERSEKVRETSPLM